MLKAIYLIALRGLHPSGNYARGGTFASAILGGLTILIGLVGIGFATTFQSDCSEVAKKYRGEFKFFGVGSSEFPAETDAGIHQVCMESGLVSGVVSARMVDGLFKIRANNTEHEAYLTLLGIGRVSGVPSTTFLSNQIGHLRKGAVEADWGALDFSPIAGGSAVTITSGGHVVSLIASEGLIKPSPAKEKVVVVSLDDLEPFLATGGQKIKSNVAFAFAKPGADIKAANDALEALVKKWPEGTRPLVSYWKDEDEAMLQILKGLWIIVTFTVSSVLIVCFTFAICNLLSIRRSHQDADLAFAAIGLSSQHWHWIAAMRGSWLGVLSAVVAAIFSISAVIIASTNTRLMTEFAIFHLDKAAFLASFILVVTTVVLLLTWAGLLSEWLFRKRLNTTL